MTSILAGAAMLAVSAVASAQPGTPPPQPRGTVPGYYGAPPPPPMYHDNGYFFRHGLTLGASFGVGGMDSDTGAIQCVDCGGDPLAGGGAFHIGGMLNPRLALMFEFWGTVKQLDAQGVNMFGQYMAMVAAQYWVAPRVWIKGGIGVSHLSLSYDDGWEYADEPVADGGAVMGAIGYEVLAAPRFAIDVQARLGVGMYEGLGIGNQIQSGTVGLGFSWF